MILVGFSVSRSLSLTPTRITSFSDFPAKMCFFFFFLCLFVPPVVHTCVYLPVHLSVCLSAVWASVCLSICPSVCLLYGCLPTVSVCCLSTCLSLHLSICLYAFWRGWVFVCRERPWRYLITLFPDRPILFWQIETRNRLSLRPSTSPIVSLLVGLFVSPSLGPSVGIFSICPFVCAAFLTAWWRLLEN